MHFVFFSSIDIVMYHYVIVSQYIDYSRMSVLLYHGYCGKHRIVYHILYYPAIPTSTPSHSSVLYFQASTPYSLESESLRMDCIMSGGASPTLAINAVTNKVQHQLLLQEGLVFQCLNSVAEIIQNTAIYRDC